MILVPHVAVRLARLGGMGWRLARRAVHERGMAAWAGGKRVARAAAVCPYI